MEIYTQKINIVLEKNGLIYIKELVLLITAPEWKFVFITSFGQPLFTDSNIDTEVLV